MAKQKKTPLDVLRDLADRLGFTIAPKPQQPAPPARPPRKPGEVARLVEIKRHIAGPPRRSPGQRLWLTAAQIRQQGLGKGDFTYVAPPTKPAKPVPQTTP